MFELQKTIIAAAERGRVTTNSEQASQLGAPHV